MGGVASGVVGEGVTESIFSSGKRKKKESLKDPSRMETRQSRLYHNCMLLDPNGLLPFDEHLFICP